MFPSHMLLNAYSSRIGRLLFDKQMQIDSEDREVRELQLEIAKVKAGIV